ncbi:MAG: hypothetical protein A4E57_00449 [Syntrophorhabdaceae bacterium PtaU1.Bin034]|jgi:uncharacterized protein (DUF1015 family)|nr:MAG: hypothetical protein A4E57_00449 [Syntrophorhabdaceae bacterium PtaU1.Bin034]
MSEPLIKPFKGLLYNKDKIDDISSCVCPPYDVISDPEPYYKRSPFNAVHLELPRPGNDLDCYGTARKTLDGWLDEEVLSFDGCESIYIYEQEFIVHGATRRRAGIIPMVRLDRERILTHEETRKKAREDREKLIETLKTFTSLIFAMYEDRTKDIEKLLANAQKELIYDFADEDSIRNRFYRMTDSAEITRLASLIDEKNLYIADGHHRLSVSFKLGLPYVAIYLTDMHSDGIQILPYHRVIRLKEKRSIDGLLSAAENYFEVTRVAYHDAGVLEQLVGEISSSPYLSFLVYFRGEKPSLRLLKQEKEFEFDPGSHDSLKKLKVNALHSGVLKHLLGIKDEEISFLNDPKEAATLVDQGQYDLAVFVPPTSVEEVKAIAENNLYMPPKSTFFYPKLLTGLVFQKYA